MWPDNRLTSLFGIEHPIILAPMAGAMDAELAAEVSEAGGLGSLPCAMLTPAHLRDQFAQIRARTDKPVNVNFFCHAAPALNSKRGGGPVGRMQAAVASAIAEDQDWKEF